MTLNLADLQKTDYTPADDVERHAVAKVDFLYHDQHGDSGDWMVFEWDAYHLLIAKALGAFRADVDHVG